MKGYGRNESDIYKQGLDQKVVVGSLTGIDIELDTREFFKWINIENPYSKYYRNLIKDYFVNNKKFVEKDKDYIYLPLRFNSSADEEIATISEWISGEINVKKNQDNFIFPRSDFFDWIGIKDSSSFFSKLFS